jgi:hypothetical protein
VPCILIQSRTLSVRNSSYSKYGGNSIKPMAERILG